MGRSIGVLATRHLWAGIVEGTQLGAVRMFPEAGQPQVDLKSLHPGEIVAKIRELIGAVLQGQAIDSVGAGFPGVIRGGVIQESPNLGQLKGTPIATDLREALRA